jgi:hypothetical protein
MKKAFQFFLFFCKIGIKRFLVFKGTGTGTGTRIMVKGKRISISNFVSKAQTLIQLEKNGFDVKYQIQLLNKQWNNHSTQLPSVSNMISIIDFSTPFSLSLPFACKIAEKSIFGKKCISFNKDGVATWHDLEKCNDFVSMVKNLGNDEHSNNNNDNNSISNNDNNSISNNDNNSNVKELKEDKDDNAVRNCQINLLLAIQFLCSAMKKQNISPEEVQTLTLVIFSNNVAVTQEQESIVHVAIQKIYNRSGYHLSPFVLFWKQSPHSSSCSPLASFRIKG